MVTKHRGALDAVRTYISSNNSWVDLMKGCPLDDGPETAVSIHLENPPNRISSIKNKIKGLASGVWDVVKKLTEQVAPTVVKTPATIKKQERKTDPEEFGESAPQNAVITNKHNRRFDWEEFSKGLLEEVKKAPKDLKPVIHHKPIKAPPIFNWHENQAWDSMERVSKRMTIPTPDPWASETFVAIANDAIPVLTKKVKDHKSAITQYIYTWAYNDPQPTENDHRDPDRFDHASYLTILWMCGLTSASSKKQAPIEELFNDQNRSDIILFLAKCVEILDPRVRKAVSHYGHTPVMYATGDGTPHYPGTDTLWADKGNAMYDWICNRRGYFKDITLNAESKGDLLEICFNLHYMHVVLGVDLTQLFKFDSTYMTTWCLQWAMFLRDIHVSSMSGIADITDPHPNGKDLKKPARLETVCK